MSRTEKHINNSTQAALRNPHRGQTVNPFIPPCLLRVPLPIGSMYDIGTYIYIHLPLITLNIN